MSDKKFVPVMITPFNLKAKVDLDAVSTLIDFYLAAGVKGAQRNGAERRLARGAALFGGLDAMVAGVRIARKIAEQPALKPYVAAEVVPGPAVQTEEKLIDDIRNRGISNLHPVGTCRMGTGNDAVVDPRLRVYGIKGLRVADASIMPLVVGGNTNAPSIMIGEKCAAMVLDDAQAA